MKMIKERTEGQEGIGIVIFLIAAIILGLIAAWGFMNLNIWAIVIGCVGEVAWFFIFWVASR